MLLTRYYSEELTNEGIQIIDGKRIAVYYKIKISLKSTQTDGWTDTGALTLAWTAEEASSTEASGGE